MDSRDLNRINLCRDLPNLINTIDGIDKTSVSPSDIWFVSFIPETNFNGTPVGAAVMKVFPSSTNNFSDDKLDLFSSIQGIEYENTIYKQVIDPLLLNNCCPNFIMMYGMADNCTFHQVSKILDAQLENETQSEYNLERNMSMLWYGKPTQSITNNNATKPIALPGKEPYDKDSNISFILLKMFAYKHQSFENYIRTRPFDKSTWLMFFQVAVALYALDLSKMTHNDLHLKNIVIEEYDDPITINQVIYDESGSNTVYQYTSRYRAIVFDFDRSYVESLGYNLLLEDTELNYCADWAGYQCNKTNKYRDLVQVTCMALRYFIKDNSIKDELIASVTNDPIEFRRWVFDIKVSTKFNDITNRFEYIKEFVKPYCTSNYTPDMKSFPEIIQQFAFRAGDLIKTNVYLNNEPKESIYTLNPADFANNGKYIGKRR